MDRAMSADGTLVLGAGGTVVVFHGGHMRAGLPLGESALTAAGYTVLTPPGSRPGGRRYRATTVNCGAASGHDVSSGAQGERGVQHVREVHRPSAPCR